jgi:hypothetical protein
MRSYRKTNSWRLGETFLHHRNPHIAFEAFKLANYYMFGKPEVIVDGAEESPPVAMGQRRKPTTLVKLGLGSPAGQVLLFSDAFDDPLCSGYLPPDALSSARGAAYSATLSADPSPSSATYRACYSAAGPPRLPRRPTTRSFCTALCPSCLPLFTGHVSSLSVMCPRARSPAHYYHKGNLTRAWDTKDYAES